MALDLLRRVTLHKSQIVLLRPGFAENQHRTNAFEVVGSATLDLGGGRRASVGGATGGDWVASTNLGDRRYFHQSLYSEMQLPLSARM